MEKYTYKDAGVNIEAGYESVERIKKHVKRTFNSNVVSQLGGFGGMFDLPSGYKQPVLVSGTDGVGTKLIIAQEMDKHDTIGIDCVAMCVNDILCQGARPLFFLDYIACGKNEPAKIEEIVKGVVQGCIESEAALIGGETAEMPDMYTNDEYDIAGFVVGVAEKEKLITGNSINKKDVIIGLPSNGIHSNGFSLVRKLFFQRSSYTLNQYINEFGTTLGETLLAPTKIYSRDLKDIFDSFDIKGISHITGGGFYENIPRVLPQDLSANIYKSSIPELPVFEFIKKLGSLDERDMFSTFNMGIGLVIVISEENAHDVISKIQGNNGKPVVLGEIVEGDGGINLCP